MLSKPVPLKDGFFGLVQPVGIGQVGIEVFLELKNVDWVPIGQLEDRRVSRVQVHIVDFLVVEKLNELNLRNVELWDVHDA